METIIYATKSYSLSLPVTRKFFSLSPAKLNVFPLYFTSHGSFRGGQTSGVTILKKYFVVGPLTLCYMKLNRNKMSGEKTQV